MLKVFRIHILGAVQGVGFRPFVFRLAKEMNLTGWVLNSAQGVFIEIEGLQNILQNFLLRLEKEKPSLASICNLEYSFHDPVGYSNFEIKHSKNNGKKTAFILPDIATCQDCLNELFNPNDRRYRYPFINCTNCGPRFSIIRSLPYDRPNTSMKNFKMCSDCQSEYNDPADRRFHAQPNACPVCGPQIELWNNDGKVIAKFDDVLLQAAKFINEGKILALKGIGGFQLIVDARSDEAVNQLRKRKHRNEKPFALMYPSLDSIKEDCIVSPLEEGLLLSTASPIVLLKKINQSNKAKGYAPENPNLGIMLPCSPLHHLLLNELNFPVIATSGNLSDEPICIDEIEAVNILKNIADFFLVHNRPIERQVDDSVARVILGHEQILRRARGYAPLPLHLNESVKPMIAVGAHLKNTIAMSSGTDIFVSQHIGDLETTEAYSAFQKVINDFQNLYEVKPQKFICDLHPEYLSTKYAKKLSNSVIAVQHHYAHITACMADNDIDSPVFGICWDGTGYGTDGTIWGGEFLLINENSYQRSGFFRRFNLPGGEASIKEPRRTAVGILYEIFGDKLFNRSGLLPIQNFSGKELKIIRQILDKKLNSPLTSSVGRIFDAVASIIGLRQKVSFEGQAAMELEFAIQNGISEVYPFEITNEKPFVVDWERMILKLTEDVKNKINPGIISAKFHNTLAEIIVNAAHLVDVKKIVITGGCFQNKYLTEKSVSRLKEEGFEPYWHQRIPPNDGGISVGQIAAAVRMEKNIENLVEKKYHGHSEEVIDR